MAMRSGSIGRGWELTKESWAVVRGDRSLLAFPVIAAACAIVAGAVLFGAGAAIGTSVNSLWAAVPFIVAGVYVIIVIGQFCAVALAACALESLGGRDTKLADGIAAARGRTRVILAWAGVMLVVGAAITALQLLMRDAAGSLVSNLLGTAANLAWSVVTFFVVPVLAFEGLGPREALKRSVHIVRERWGEGVTGTAAIGAAIFVAGILPGGVILGAGIALTASSAVLGGALIAVGVLVIVVAGLLQTTLSAVFRVALYRFATQGEALGRFTPEQLDGAFRPRRGAFARRG